MRFKALVALSTALLFLATPAHGSAFPEVVNGSAPSLHPEGTAYDPTRNAFLVSSIRHGTVSVVRPDGRTSTLISHPWMISTLGVKVDVRRQRVLVAHGDLGVGARSTPETAMHRSGIGIFDLRTGALRQFVDLAAVAGPGLHLANDLALASDGTAYVTDALSDALLRIDVRGRAAVLVRDARFHDPDPPTSFGLNGIVWHPRGYLLVVKSWGGQLFRISLGHKPSVRQVATDQPIHNGDGLVLRPDGSLLAVTNPLGPQGVSAVRLLRSRDGWSSARTTCLLPWPDVAPTTATRTPAGNYVLDGRLDVLFGGSGSDHFTLRKATFSAMC
ncbi:hypothetical protein E0H75_20805 [Kribbella capetownensis]|uniref:SMP-30/Gluconolactonase/LRE-like region domain-containing protein n=1 Tax=Kribbella capetownensis TaxID=1572659 RepID=A0A4R0JRB1_9ACTN|nr:SMP-30/gluconolactonase/LRE family protein [Kribbella capetownensis]TCC48997.1 hypothetical protein E0H75_20805 [Kribbella capetownensis]